MKISQLFTGRSGTENHVEEGGRATQSQYARTVELNRQIHSLVPGQTLRGEIVGRSGSEVQIRISEDMVMNARVDQSINLEMGKSVTFEVKSNGGTLSLIPLFTNIAADANVLKALDMAGLPVNDVSVAMTEQLMKAGLSVNRNSLQQVYREINSFPEGDISDVVNLHKLQMPVNAANMQQMASYRNLTHQLISGMTSVFEAIPDAAEGMLAAGNPQGAVELYRELLTMVQGGPETAEAVSEDKAAEITEGAEQAVLGGADAESESAGAVSGGQGTVVIREDEESAAQGIVRTAEGDAAKETAAGADGTAAGAVPDETAENAGGSAANAGAVPQEGVGARERTGGVSVPVSAETRRVLADNMRGIIEGLQLPAEEAAAFTEAVRRFGEGDLPTGDFFRAAAGLLEAAGHSGKGLQQIQGLFSGKEFRSVLAAQMKAGWTISPEDVSQPEKVEELYRRINRQLKGLTQVLEAGGQGESAAFKAVTNMSQNVDFMNQINQMYAYVQLPLRLQQSEAHGDLYVYTNKRSLADNDGKVSALLHLDMEHLGPVDVYVTLRDKNVSTNFYVADDEILDFIEAHLDILTERLEKRGYSCSASATKRGEKEEREEGALAPLLRQEKGILLSQYAFDVRT